jgi:hypothetical protein
MESHIDKFPPLQISARVRHEIQLRIHELQCRRHLTARDRLELSRLREFLETVTVSDGKEAMQW